MTRNQLETLTWTSLYHLWLGMITFPLNVAPFQDLGPDGISMFFVSCVVSQLVYSLGGSAFKGGNGSMMIEVVPFLHLM